MFRWTLRLFTFVLLILSVASAALWVRSYLLVDHVVHQRVERSGATLSMDQRIGVSWRGQACLTVSHRVWTLPHRDLPEKQIEQLRSGWRHDRFDGDSFGGNIIRGTKVATKYGFGRGRTEIKSEGVTVKGYVIIFPWAAAVLVLGIVPFIGIIHHIKTRRRLRRLAALHYSSVQMRDAA